MTNLRTSPVLRFRAVLVAALPVIWPGSVASGAPGRVLEAAAQAPAGSVAPASPGAPAGPAARIAASPPSAYLLGFWVHLENGVRDMIIVLPSGQVYWGRQAPGRSGSPAGTRPGPTGLSGRVVGRQLVFGKGRRAVRYTWTLAGPWYLSGSQRAAGYAVLRLQTPRGGRIRFQKASDRTEGLLRGRYCAAQVRNGLHVSGSVYHLLRFDGRGRVSYRRSANLTITSSMPSSPYFYQGDHETPRQVGVYATLNGQVVLFLPDGSFWMGRILGNRLRPVTALQVGNLRYDPSVCSAM